MSADLLDNQFSLETNDAMGIINNFFKQELEGFILLNEYSDPRGYWGLEYIKDECIVKIESGRGVLEPSIMISGTKYVLSQFDKRMGSVKVSSRKNILFTLDTIKRFLKNP